MYAIVEIAGKQYRVEKDMKLKLPLLETAPGKTVDFDRVLLLEDDKGNVTLGTPTVKDTSVSAKIVEHGKDKKIIVFKKKRRKGYQKKRGHRQDFSMVEITAIGASKKAKKTEKTATAESKAETAAKAAPKTATNKPTTLDSTGRLTTPNKSPK